MSQIVKRIWSKKSQMSEHTDMLDIWDSGSHIFERWPNGTEIYWKVISREMNELGFIEHLEQLPNWQTPGQVMRREQIPLQQSSPSQFTLGVWSVEQVVERNCNTVEVKRKEHNIAHHKHNNKGKRHSPNVFTHKEKPTVI